MKALLFLLFLTIACVNNVESGEAYGEIVGQSISADTQELTWVVQLTDSKQFVSCPGSYITQSISPPAVAPTVVVKFSRRVDFFTATNTSESATLRVEECIPIIVVLADVEAEHDPTAKVATK